MCSVRNQNNFWYIDCRGKRATKDLKGEGGSFSEGLATIKVDAGQYGFINKKGQIGIKAMFESVSGSTSIQQ